MLWLSFDVALSQGQNDCMCPSVLAHSSSEAKLTPLREVSDDDGQAWAARVAVAAFLLRTFALTQPAAEQTGGRKAPSSSSATAAVRWKQRGGRASASHTGAHAFWHPSRWPQ